MAGFKFWYSDDWYTVQGAETILSTGTKADISTLRAEYTRMRDVAQKRLGRLREQFPQTEAVKSHKKGFKRLRDMNPSDLPYAFAELYKFLNAKGSTVTGQKEIQEKTIKKLNEATGHAGGEEGGGVNKDNYWRVIRILNEARKLKLVYDSEKMVELAEATMALSDAQFEKVIAHLEKFLANSDSVSGMLEYYATTHKIEDYQKIDIDDFASMLG